MFTAAQVKSHSTVKDAWLILHDKVYNITSFLKQVFRGAIIPFIDVSIHFIIVYLASWWHRYCTTTSWYKNPRLTCLSELYSNICCNCLGQDATEAFEMIGHSEYAYELFKKYYIGDLKKEKTGDKNGKAKVKENPKSVTSVQPSA